ncbi:hypothetical protein C8R46DRAFT_1037644 [Mycena filopes]|nr:hypothetical protein C8R46DRAFT_1037644 [Mycena filopes]
MVRLSVMGFNFVNKSNDSPLATARMSVGERRLDNKDPYLDLAGGRDSNLGQVLQENYCRGSDLLAAARIGGGVTEGYYADQEVGPELKALMARDPRAHHCEADYRRRTLTWEYSLRLNFAVSISAPPAQPRATRRRTTETCPGFSETKSRKSSEGIEGRGHGSSQKYMCLRIGTVVSRISRDGLKPERICAFGESAAQIYDENGTVEVGRDSGEVDGKDGWAQFELVQTSDNTVIGMK